MVFVDSNPVLNGVRKKLSDFSKFYVHENHYFEFPQGIKSKW